MKRLTSAQFLQATSSLTMGVSALEIVEGILVDGKPQSDNVSAMQNKVGAVLPEYLAFIV